MYRLRVGTIDRTGPRLTFTYDDRYAAEPNPTPLSLSMPVSSQPYTNRWVEAHLRGLLPDHADVRQRWAAHFGVRDRDTFGLIRAIGADTAGGAVYVTEDQADAALAGNGWLEPYTDHEIADRLRRLRADEGTGSTTTSTGAWQAGRASSPSPGLSTDGPGRPDSRRRPTSSSRASPACPPRP